MKFLSILALGLLTLGATASVPSDLKQYQIPSLEIQAKTNPNITGMANTGLMTAHGTVYTNITNVCISGDKVKTIQDVTMCSKMGYKPLTRARCQSKNKTFPCFDTKERACLEYAKVPGTGLINSTMTVCAKLSDKESWEWKRTHNDDDKFKNEYPNCSAFKTFPVTRITTFDFNIVKPTNMENSVNYKRTLGGILVDQVRYELPTCSEL